MELISVFLFFPYCFFRVLEGDSDWNVIYLFECLFALVGGGSLPL
ncbi:hypothetical protein QSH57_002062 [Fusarium oxysporum f. sp. vasinfectum]|nr:hypothetical protein QSH57_002062 [Fusarium oxysporum f. sp. vasinfectum]